MELYKRLLLICLLCSVVCCRDASADKLNKFEKDATKHRENKRDDNRRRRRDYSGYDSGNEGSSNLTEAIGLIFLGASAYGFQNSYNMIHAPSTAADAASPPSISVKLREPGDPVIPYFRFDSSYQRIDSDTDATDFYSQIGYGPAAVDMRLIRFNEKDHTTGTTTHLDIKRVHFLGRMSYGSNFEVDAGVGWIQIDGQQRSDGFSFTLPILYYPSQYWGVEFRPAWANINGSSIEEYDVSAHLCWKHIGIKAGYRWLKSEETSLNGPYAGVVIRY